MTRNFVTQQEKCSEAQKQKRVSIIHPRSWILQVLRFARKLHRSEDWKWTDPELQHCSSPFRHRASSHNDFLFVGGRGQVTLRSCLVLRFQIHLVGKNNVLESRQEIKNPATQNELITHDYLLQGVHLVEATVFELLEIRATFLNDLKIRENIVARTHMVEIAHVRRHLHAERYPWGEPEAPRDPQRRSGWANGGAGQSCGTRGKNTLSTWRKMQIRSKLATTELRWL